MAVRFATKQTVFNCPTWRHLDAKREPEVKQPLALPIRIVIAVLEIIQAACIVLAGLLVLGFIMFCARGCRRN